MDSNDYTEALNQIKKNIIDFKAIELLNKTGKRMIEKRREDEAKEIEDRIMSETQRVKAEINAAYIKDHPDMDRSAYKEGLRDMAKTLRN